MNEVDLVGDEDANKRTKRSRGKSFLTRCRQAFFLSGMALFVGASTFALSSEPSDATGAERQPVASDESRKELCLFRLEQKFWESFGAGESAEPETRTDAMQDCGDVVSGKDIFSAKDRSGLEREIATLVSGYPIEAMAPFIASYDRDIAALLVGIAKKESAWGERVPLDEAGKDCFNYWGYKGAGARGIAMGHGCFGSPEEAVRMVGNRLVELVALRKTSDPQNMIIWKCGSSCAGHSPESVRKWIADVSLYYDKIVRL